MMINIKKYFAVALSLSATSLFADEIFDGSKIQGMLDVAAKSAEKRVVLEEGVYFLDKPLQLSNEHSGVTLEGDDAILCGGKKIKSWKKDGKFLRAKVDTDIGIYSMFVNGKRAFMAEMGAKDAKCFKALGKNLGTRGGESKKFAELNSMLVSNSDIAELLKLSASERKRVYLDFYLAWYNPRYRIEEIIPSATNENASIVYFRNTMTLPREELEKLPVRSFKFRTVFRFGDKARFRISNAPFALDEQGEFFFDKSKKEIVYFPREGETAESIDAWYPVAGKLLNVSGKDSKNPAKNITIRGIEFKYGRSVPNFSDDSWNASQQAASTVDGFVSLSNAENALIEKCKVSHCDTYGIALGAGVWNSAVRDCEIFDAGTGGIKIGVPFATKKNGIYKAEGEENSIGQPNDNSDPRLAGNNTLDNNIIYYYGRWDKAGCGIIAFNSGHNTISNNTIFDGFYTGISVGWCWGFGASYAQNTKIVDNKIFNIGHGVMDDMGGIYTLGNADGSVISGNRIFDITRHKYGAWGIYNDEGSSGWLITNNYVNNTEEDSYFQHFGHMNTVRNNVFQGSARHAIGVGPRKEKFPDELVFESNIVVYKSPCVLLRGNRPYVRAIARFDRNMYWNENGDVLFGKLPLEIWQRVMGQDWGSIIANPELDKKGIPQNEDYKKIGFIPFDTSKAGVKNDMLDRFEDIFEDYVLTKPYSYR